MDRELIERLAREASADLVKAIYFDVISLWDMERFATLVAEECAKACDALDNGSHDNLTPIAAADIRTRFTPPLDRG